MSAFFVALLDPQVIGSGIGAVLMAVIPFLIWRIHRDRTTMNPDLAKVRAAEKVINRVMPRSRVGNASVDDGIKMLEALGNCLSPTGQPPGNADDVRAQGSSEDRTPNEEPSPETRDGP